MRAAPSEGGCMSSLLIRTGLPQKVLQLSTKPVSFAGHQLDRQRLMMTCGHTRNCWSD